MPTPKTPQVITKHARHTPPREIVYRQRAGSDTWHWACDVARRPRPDDRIIVDIKRPKGDLCNRCRSREARAR